MKYEEIRISVPWGHIAGRWYGEKNVRPILALHGWQDNCGSWETLIPLMPRHIGVLAIDLPGHGKSSRYPIGIPYNIFTNVIVMMIVMLKYKWDKISILSHSVSSMSSFVFTLLYPERVDMLIQVDLIYPRNPTPKDIINYMQTKIENFLTEEERIKQQGSDEPPIYSYDEIIERIHVGSNRSLNKDKCKHIMKNSVTRSGQHPSKYYFSRDPRVKHQMQYFTSVDGICLMAKHVRVPQIVIKSSNSNFIDLNDPAVQMLRDNNPYFELHVVEGTHHVHLNNAPEIAVLVNTFINRWRPPSIVEGMESRSLFSAEKRHNSQKAEAKL